MSPRQTVCDSVDIADGDLMLFSKRSTCNAVTQITLNRNHLYARKFCAWVVFSKARIKNNTPLLGLVAHVICVRSEKEMFKIYATGIVAAMAYAETVRYRTIGVFPGLAVKAHESITALNASITAFVFVASPLPTAGLFVDHRPCPHAVMKRDAFMWSRHAMNPNFRQANSPARSVARAGSAPC